MAIDRAIDSAQLDIDLTAVADAIRAKGGTTDALTFPGGFVSAVEAIQAGGGGVSLPYEGAANPVGFQNFFYILGKGEAISGEFTISSWLSSGTEYLIFDTGLSVVRGIFIMDVDIDVSNIGSLSKEGTFFSFAIYNSEEMTATLGASIKPTSGSAYANTAFTLFNRTSSHRWDGGKYYITPQFGGSSYPPIYAGHRYVWVAWGDK